MTVQHTLSIVKPDAVGRNIVGEVIRRLEKGGLAIIAAKMMHLSKAQAEEFYGIHKGRPFYDALVSFMISGPVLVMVLEGEDAITKNREIMGATNPANAAPGTIRADLAKSIDENVVHGSDAPETAKTEIAFFFKPQELCPRTRRTIQV